MKMALPGLLIEYLISGVIALIWAYPAILKDFNIEINTLILLPAIYVLGMMVDIVAFFATKIPKYAIRKSVRKKHGLPEAYQTGANLRRHILITMKCEEIAQELERRSSRDRIARGTMINIIPISIAYDAISIPFGIAAFFATATMWAYFEYSSYNYSVVALDLLSNHDRSLVADD